VERQYERDGLAFKCVLTNYKFAGDSVTFKSPTVPEASARTVASGDFNFAKRPFILSYGLRCKVRVCGDFVIRHRKQHMRQLHTRS